MPVPERYIVQIYRREGTGGSLRVAGLVEKVGNGSPQSFSSGMELWNLLNAASQSPSRPSRVGGKPRKR
jgi:hypothetical protein